MIIKRAVVVLVLLVSGILLMETITWTRQQSAESAHIRFAGTDFKKFTPPTKKQANGKTKNHNFVNTTIVTSTKPMTPTTMKLPASSSTTTAITSAFTRIGNINQLHVRSRDKGNYEKRLMEHIQHTLHSANVNRPNKTIILIVAYLRSGSSFTASLFSHAPGTFFVFEPLHMLHKKAKEKEKIIYLNGTTRTFPDGTVSQDHSMVSLESWMGCRFNKIDKDSLLDSFHAIYSINSTKSFLFCVKHRQIRKHPTLHAIKECLPRLELKCNMATKRAFKTIRLSMKSAEDLLEKYPNLRVIHLVRDPRGMFLSQMSERLIDGNFKDHINNYCKRIIKDMEVSKRILKSHRRNLMVVRYEDLALDPIGEAKKLYKFTGVEFTEELKTYVYQSTSQNLNDDCNYCTTRSNSSRTAFKWRRKITPLVLSIVNRHCGEAMRQTGYIKLNRFTQIRNETVPSISNINFGK